MDLRNLGKRLLFVLWAVPAGWWVINADFSVLPPGFARDVLHAPNLVVFPGQIASLVLILLAAREYIRMLSIRFPRNGFWLIYAWLLYQFITYYLPGNRLNLRFDKDIYFLLLLVGAEAILWGKSSQRWKRASLLFSATVFLAVAGFSMFALYEAPFQTVFPRKFSQSMLSQMGIVTVCASIFLCDSAAYLLGSSIGRHHFSSISPHKTVEGSVAGLAASLAIAIAGWYFFAGERLPLAWGVGMGLLIGTFAQAGDALVSLMKRYFQVKDSSDIIPGHGGVLDRFDSLFFTMPVLSVYFGLVEWIYR
jgi:phosphatidate cytidylyltransferase